MKPLWWVKATRFEYWPWWAFYLPLLPYYLWLSAKARSLAFFAAVNPGIPLGGLVGESKFDILRHIRPEYKPRTALLPPGSGMEQATAWMGEQGLSFPIVAKPNVGERGKQVEKVEDAGQLRRYLALHAAEAILLQEYAAGPLELGVFFYRLPHEPLGRVSSVCVKAFLSVEGNGADTVGRLLAGSERARFQLPRLRREQPGKLASVPRAGERVLVEPIGNHCRGTAFLDGNRHITPGLHRIFSDIAADVPGFYYGRFDLRVPSLEDLQAGRNIRVVELNGVSAEPAHIYDPGYPLLRAYRDLAAHWRVACRIACEVGTEGLGLDTLAAVRQVQAKPSRPAKAK